LWFAPGVNNVKARFNYCCTPAGGNYSIEIRFAKSYFGQEGYCFSFPSFVYARGFQEKIKKDWGHRTVTSSDWEQDRQDEKTHSRPCEKRDFTDALHASWMIQERVSALGFDWPDIGGVFDKVAEELQEIRDAHDSGDNDHARRELGDLLFAAVNLARFLDVHPGEALAAANDRFERRFALLETELERGGIRMEACTIEELDAVWNRVKQQLRDMEKGP